MDCSQSYQLFYRKKSAMEQMVIRGSASKLSNEDTTPRSRSSSPVFHPLNLPVSSKGMPRSWDSSPVAPPSNVHSKDSTLRTRHSSPVPSPSSVISASSEDSSPHDPSSLPSSMAVERHGSKRHYTYVTSFNLKQKTF